MTSLFLASYEINGMANVHLNWRVITIINMGLFCMQVYRKSKQVCCVICVDFSIFVLLSSRA